MDRGAWWVQSIGLHRVRQDWRNFKCMHATRSRYSEHQKTIVNFFYHLFIYFTLQYCIGFAIHQHESPRVYMSSQSWTPLTPPSLYHLSGSSQCTSPKRPVSCTEPRLVIHFLHDIIHVSMPFPRIIPPSPSPTESKSLFYTSVSLLLSCTQGYHYHL